MISTSDSEVFFPNGEPVSLVPGMVRTRWDGGSATRLVERRSERPGEACEKKRNDFFLKSTLLETNIAPENTPLEKEIPIGNHHL